MLDWCFLAGPRRPIRETNIKLPEVRVAYKPEEILLFDSPPHQAQENIALLMASSFQRREKAVPNVCKRRPKTEPENNKKSSRCSFQAEF